MRQETWDEFHARLAANREKGIAECTDPQEYRLRVEAHICALTIEAALDAWNKQTAKRMGLI